MISRIATESAIVAAEQTCGSAIERGSAPRIDTRRIGGLRFDAEMLGWVREARFSPAPPTSDASLGLPSRGIGPGVSASARASTGRSGSTAASRARRGCSSASNRARDAGCTTACCRSVPGRVARGPLPSVNPVTQLARQRPVAPSLVRDRRPIRCEAWIGWGTWIRTTIGRVRICSPTIRRSPSRAVREPPKPEASGRRRIIRRMDRHKPGLG